MKTLHGLKEYDVIYTHKMGAVVGPPLFNLIPESLSSNNYLSIILHGSYWNRMNNYRIRGSQDLKLGAALLLVVCSRFGLDCTTLSLRIFV